MLKKLSIDDPIGKVLPDAPKDKAIVTLRQLLNHTSGIDSGFKNEWDFDPFDVDSLVNLVLRLPMESAPGEKWDYSNSSYALAGAVVGKVSGDTFEEYTIRELFRPAGMKDACFIGSPSLDLAHVPRDDRGAGVPFAYGTKLSWGYKGSGGVVATAREMLLWDCALRGDKLLDAAAKKAYYAPALDDYALGWFVLKGSKGFQYEHGGGVGKTVTYYMRSVEEDIVVALATSCRPKTHPQHTAQALAQIVRNGE